MIQLLQEWDKLAPEECNFTKLPTFNRYRLTIPVKGEEPATLVIRSDRNLTLLQRGVIREALERAITARGWGYQVHHSGLGDTALIATGQRFAMPFEANGRSPLGALLSAYLQALSSKRVAA